MTMKSYPPGTMELLSELLVARAKEFGAEAFAIESEILDSAAALDPAGPLLWAMCIHAVALSQISAIAGYGSNPLPFTPVEDPSAPFNMNLELQPGSLSMVKAVLLMDSALEHCVCLGVRSYGYTPSQWADLPFHEKVIPVEGYLADLQQWTDAAENLGNRVTTALTFPRLTTRQDLEQLMTPSQRHSPEEQQTAVRSRPVSFSPT